MGVHLEFTEDAIDAIITQAVQMKSGARALRSLVERAVAEGALSSFRAGRERVRCIITAESVESGNYRVEPDPRGHEGQEEPLQTAGASRPSHDMWG